MEISQLNMRGRMAYGILCLIAYLRHNKIDASLHKEEIDVLSEYTSSADPVEFDNKEYRHPFSALIR